MSGKKVTVTYCDEYDVWPLIADDLSSRLPLKGLVWQSSNQRVERHIQSLEVDLKRFNFEQVPQPLSTTQTNYLNLYFVSCDDNEAYKTKVRRQIRNWVDIIMTKKNQDWLIVYVASPDSKKTNSYLGLKSSVYDKIRTDFNQGKQERCAYIRINDSDGPSSELWTTFVEKMKESILTSFDMQVQQIQEDTRRLDMQRHMPGWNYCTFFILKEGLAQSFEIMTLYEDALIQYDELEASFFQVLRDKALAWFGHFGGTDPGDDSGNIMDFKRKDYRDLINKNIISVFDFRSYLFARQCRMLLKLQRIVEICSRAQFFITSFIPSIRENKEHLTNHFLESWVFSACMNVVNECEPFSAQMAAIDPDFISTYSAVKADLLLTARRQLDKLGVQQKHLPNTAPFSIYLDTQIPPNNETTTLDDSKTSNDITNQKLLEAIDSVDAFDKMYMALSTRAIKSYDSSGRSRAALGVHGDIAALKYTREKYDEAVRIFESMIWRYGEQDWSFIENSLLVKCADSQKRLNKINQYVESLLALLKNSSCLSSCQAAQYADELIANVGKLDKEIKKPFSPMLSVSVVSILDDEKVESTSVEILIENNLTKALHFDNLQLQLVGNDPEETTFYIKNNTIQPGKNTFLLTSDISTSGNYVVESCQMFIGKLIFHQVFMNADQKKRVIRLNHDSKRLIATVSQPTEVRLGERQSFAVRIQSKETPITNGRLLLEPQTEGLEIINTNKVPAKFKTHSGDIKQLELDMQEDGHIILPACDAHEELELAIIYEGSYTEFDYRVKTTVSYTCAGTERKFVSADTISVAVPLSVTESSIFRETCIFLKVELSCNGTLPVRILGSSLSPSKVYAVESQSQVNQWNLTLFPRQTATFVYKLIKRNEMDTEQGVTDSLRSKVHFEVKYRTLKDEVETSVSAMLERKLREHHLGQHFTYVFSKVREAFLSSVDYSSYGLMDVVHLDDFDAELCESFLLHRDLKTKVELLDLIEEFFEEHEAITMKTIKEQAPKDYPQHGISFPLDVPTSKILHTAELILSNDSSLIVSDACPCVLQIKQSTYWCATTDTNDQTQDYIYDIDIDYDNWLLSGKRRLRFSSKPGETMEFPLSLIPLKTGNLLLPPVRVSSISSDIFAATVYTNSAQQILVKPKSKTATFFIEQQQRILAMQPSYADDPTSRTLPETTV
ncbi:trafficking protein particle complex subunit 10 [Halteromyces radiatus]|uniref:trafficking protein particle complex subunit 10 n=1 Tax=Halteromyces radiatus TaxID=101107 RepID=UPI00221EF9C9|nr:trafficking protein particle complex subunit 10 [Halteromyces radiatus]KAI8089523.1 trafficking protein particle complex subunit 10 [Halteromyces radiatus]